ncbi:MAG: phage holin family protein [Thermoleophilia bacterium]
MTTTDRRHRPIGDLLGDFTEQATTLIGHEVELARAEVSEQVSRAGRASGMFGVAAMLGLCGLGALTAAAVLGLAEALDAWLAALIIGAGLVLVAAVFALVGRARLKAIAPPMPEKALSSMRRDVEAVQRGVQDGLDGNGNGGGQSHGA